ncbi:MAG: GHKL domain-containing protein [Bacteroidetes bacterium]|nr:MAG: GHKL domain-containing protein [Bacteroidota bacterium]
MSSPLMVNSLRSKLVLLLISVVCFSLAYFFSGKGNSDFSSAAMEFEKILHEKEQHAKEELKALAVKAEKWSYHKMFSEKPGYYESLFDREGFVFLVFENDSLRFWTDNTVAVNQHLPKNSFSGKIARLPNGWFGIERLEQGNKKLFALILLKRQYAYQNKYLTNEFQRDFHLNEDVEIAIDVAKAGKKGSGFANNQSGDVYERKGDYLCTLAFPASNHAAPFAFYPAIFLNLFGCMFFLWALQAEVDSIREKVGREWSALILVLMVAALRYLTLLTDFPEIFYDTQLFNPGLYGDAAYPWLGSLGDLLINAVLIFYLVFYAYRNITPSLVPAIKGKEQITTSGRNLRLSLRGWGRQFFPFVLLLALFLSSGIINYVFSGIISNSNIPFTLNDIFSQNGFTFLSLVIAGWFFVSFFLLLDRAVDFILSLELGRTGLLLYSLGCIGIFIILAHLLGTVDLILVFWPVFLFGLILWSKAKQFGYSFSVIVALLIIVSFFSAHLVLKFAERKEQGNRQLFAEKLAAEQDLLAEHLFTEAEEKISRDTALINILKHTYNGDKSPIILSSEKAHYFTRLLISKYFSGYWEKYEIKVSVFDTSCLPLVQGSLPEHDNLNYFEEVIASGGTPAKSSKFFYLTNSSGRISYLARIPLMQHKDSLYRMADLFIEFDSRIVSEEMGFPELMLDRKFGIANDLLDYSYAKYKDGNLVAYHGKFPYRLSAETFLPDSAQSLFSFIDGFSHLSYRKDKTSLVIISKKEEGRITVVTTFSYLFAFFSLLLLVLLFVWILVFDKKIQVDSFRSRIQYVLVLMVLFSLLFFGAGTIYYIQQQYERQTKQNVRDKMISALVEGMQELGEETELKQTKSDYFSYVLRRMSTIFNTDISLYDVEGNLVGSSQMKLFDEGLLSGKMSPESYYRLAILRSIEHIQDETIGNLKYLSAYCSFRNNEGKLLGYLNIPYFARQSDLEKEISAILSAIINIYVLLFVISVILALAISEYFTKPLKLIQEKLSKIKFGKANEPIEWKSEDEIGSLVNEYNRMISELQKSAELLAKSERETAWREMAKQVAHEIKNPLTPMKLSIQHLQRTWKNKDDDMDNKIERITATMIEQIETLSNIASEFSSFAKMPTSVSEKVNLKNVIENCVALFIDSTDTEFTFNCLLEEAFVFADKEQMLRVCNNLLKNALQAIPENQQGKIEVSLTKQDNALVIKIKDNGTGIAEDGMSKIFTPNFTTKTGGMGLGLAMVKSIVETFGGKIWFETSRGGGSMFFVSLPEYREG